MDLSDEAFAKASNIHSIAIRCPNWIGDAVMATPVFRQVRALFPQAKVTAVAHESIAQLLDGIDGIDEFLVFSRASSHKRHEEARVVKELKRRQIDLGILLTNSMSSAWMFWKARIRWRVGFCDILRWFLLNIPVTHAPFERHDVLTYAELLRPFGNVDENPTLQLKVREEELLTMHSRLQSLGRRADDRLLVINPGAAYGSAKCWPQQYFRTVAEALSQKQRVFCVFVGDSTSVAMIDEIISAMPQNVKSLAGATSVRDLMAVISLADCLLTNDSGPMHIAAALHRPLLAIFGSTNPTRTGPWGGGQVLYTHVPCSPCLLRKCPSDFRCMRSITPEQVVNTIEHLL